MNIDVLSQAIIPHIHWFPPALRRHCKSWRRRCRRPRRAARKSTGTGKVGHIRSRPLCTSPEYLHLLGILIYVSEILTYHQGKLHCYMFNSFIFTFNTKIIYSHIFRYASKNHLPLSWYTFQCSLETSLAKINIRKFYKYPKISAFRNVYYWSVARVLDHFYILLPTFLRTL